MMRNRRGFSLLELVIVLCILGIGGIIAFSNFQSWLRKYNFSGFQREVFSECREARSRAIASQRQHRLLINLATGSVSVQRGSAGTGSTWQSAPPVVRPTVRAPSGAAFGTIGYTPFASAPATQFALVFNPSGEVMSQWNPLNDNTIAPMTQATIALAGQNPGDLATITVYGWTGKARLN